MPRRTRSKSERRITVPSVAPVQVMVELAVDADAPSERVLAAARRLESVGFAVDGAYGSVPITPTKEDLERLNSARQRAVIVRGVVRTEQIAALESQPGVLKVWADGVIEPFVSSKTLKHRPPRPKAKPKTGPFPQKPKPHKVGIAPPPPDCTGGNFPMGSVDDVVTKLGVDKIWSAGYTGAGIVIGMVDGGICAATSAPNPCGVQISGVIGGYPSDWGTTSAGWDQHGNMTAFDALSMAPDAQLYDIRIVSQNTGNPAVDFKAWVSEAVKGYDWAIAQHQANGTPQILNNSWGLYKRSVDPGYAANPQSPFARKVEEALAEGILVLFAAGNCGAACALAKCGGSTNIGPGKSILGPNGHADVMTVGAVNLSRVRVGYSSQGPAVLPPRAPKPDFCAITEFTGYYPASDPNYASDGGTSSASAVAAGVVALLKQKQPGLTQAQAKIALMSTAFDLPPAGIDRDTGAGVIRAKLAFDSI